MQKPFLWEAGFVSHYPICIPTQQSQPAITTLRHISLLILHEHSCTVCSGPVGVQVSCWPSRDQCCSHSCERSEDFYVLNNQRLTKRMETWHFGTWLKIQDRSGYCNWGAVIGELQFEAAILFYGLVNLMSVLSM